MKSKLTLGSDPEVMLRHIKTDRIVNAIPVLKCNKHNPIDLGAGYKMYADNVLVEMAIPPANNTEDFTNNLTEGFYLMKKRIGPEYSLECVASHVYDEAELTMPEAWEVGCNPNFDAYARAMNLPSEFKTGLRTGSFHIHIGHPDINDQKTKEEAVKLMDLFVGCASVIFDKDLSSKTRRALYGKAGEFRPTPYGIEYRVLGNWALRHRSAIKMVAELTEFAMEQRGTVNFNPSIDSRIQIAINTGDALVAGAILDMYGLPHDLMAKVRKDYSNNE